MRNFWCEVYLDKLKDNIDRVRNATSKKIMAVVKGNAYGLGVEKISEFLDSYVDCFAVSEIGEAYKVKSDKDILILTPDYENIDELKKIRNNFVLTIDDYQDLYKIKCSGINCKIHIYVDTGMNRFGIHPEELDKFISDLKDSPNIELQGIYTHLHNTGNEAYTLSQISEFHKCVEKYKSDIQYIHLLNSSGFIRYDSYCHFDNMVRLGNLLYGCEGEELQYQKVFQHKALPVCKYSVDKGEHVGYGESFKARRKMTVGILDFGYIDKFSCIDTMSKYKIVNILDDILRRLRHNRSITQYGKPVKIVGSVNMNYTMIDMTGISEQAIFDVDISAIAADSSTPKRYI